MDMLSPLKPGGDSDQKADIGMGLLPNADQSDEKGQGVNEADHAAARARGAAAAIGAKVALENLFGAKTQSVLTQVVTDYKDIQEGCCNPAYWKAHCRREGGARLLITLITLIIIGLSFYVNDQARANAESAASTLASVRKMKTEVEDIRDNLNGKVTEARAMIDTVQALLNTLGNASALGASVNTSLARTVRDGIQEFQNAMAENNATVQRGVSDLRHTFTRLNDTFALGAEKARMEVSKLADETGEMWNRSIEETALVGRDVLDAAGTYWHGVLRSTATNAIVQVNQTVSDGLNTFNQWNSSLTRLGERTVSQVDEAATVITDQAIQILNRTSALRANVSRVLDQVDNLDTTLQQERADRRDNDTAIRTRIVELAAALVSVRFNSTPVALLPSSTLNKDVTHANIGGDHFLFRCNFFDGSTHSRQSTLWKLNPSTTASWSLHQPIDTHAATRGEFFSADTQQYLMVTNFKTNSGTDINSVMYKMVDQQFAQQQLIATNGATGATHFELSGRHFVCLTEAYSGGASPGGPSMLLKLNTATQQLELFQSISTHMATHCLFAQVNGESILVFTQGAVDDSHVLYLAGHGAKVLVYDQGQDQFVLRQDLAGDRMQMSTAITPDSSSLFVLVADIGVVGAADNATSRLFKWNGTALQLHQSIPSWCVTGWTTVKHNSWSYVMGASSTYFCNWEQSVPHPDREGTLLRFNPYSERLEYVQALPAVDGWRYTTMTIGSGLYAVLPESGTANGGFASSGPTSIFEFTAGIGDVSGIIAKLRLAIDAH